MKSLLRRIRIDRKLGELLDQAVGDRTAGPVFLCPSGRGWRVENLSRTVEKRGLAPSESSKHILMPSDCEVPVPLFQHRAASSARPGPNFYFQLSTRHSLAQRGTWTTGSWPRRKT
jgi:hypothetical protein